MKLILNFKKSRKGQVFTLDFFLGLLAFIALLALGFTQLFSFLPSAAFENLYDDAVYVSNILIESGYPLDWNETNVILPGVADAHRLNITKLKSYSNLSYEHTKILLHIPSDYIFYFQNKTHNLNLSSCTYGYPIVSDINCTPQLTSITYKNLVKTQRLLAFNGTILTMVLYTWND